MLEAQQRDLLRRLTLNDEKALRDVITGRIYGSDTLLDDKNRALVKVAALVALDSETASLQAGVDVAHAAGAADEEIIETVLVIAPIVGTTRIGSANPRLAAVLRRE
ncbi:MAG: carboxymuconolactone decarboxylase family protein [Acidimicrobiia bacterium]